jgi:hypothetical protein
MSDCTVLYSITVRDLECNYCKEKGTVIENSLYSFSKRFVQYFQTEINCHLEKNITANVLLQVGLLDIQNLQKEMDLKFENSLFVETNSQF